MDSDSYRKLWPDPAVPFEKTATTLLSLINNRKIRVISVSNFSPQQMQDFQKYAPIFHNVVTHHLGQVHGLIWRGYKDALVILAA